MCKHLESEAKGFQYLVLWLDCDREGENICFEVCLENWNESYRKSIYLSDGIPLLVPPGFTTGMIHKPTLLQISDLLSMLCCLKVMDHTLPSMQKIRGQQVFRAKFSAISSVEIKAAMVISKCELNLKIAQRTS